jgi:hypothetical protein
MAVQCPRCRSALLTQVFPVLNRVEQITGPGQVALEGEATCFFHPAKRAAVVCDHCGRFLCQLCDLPVGTRHVCPKCLAAGMDKVAPMPELLNQRVSWGLLSLLVAAVPMFLCGLFAFFVTGPAAIFCTIYGWNKPGSIVHGKRRVSAILGGLIGLAEVCVLLGMGYFMWKGITRG